MSAPKESNRYRSKKEYLGDGVYVDCDDYGVTLTTENCLGPSDTIVLQWEVLTALNNYLKRVGNH